MERLIHTPEGVRDIYDSECEKKKYLQQQVYTVFQSFGYQSIETPSFEYFDVFSREVGTTPSKDLYKFFDRDGNTLVLRPDFTPSIARAVSMYYMQEEMPIRLCYQGSVFVNSSSYRGHMNEATQMGVELLNDDSAAADAELIAMIVQVMQKSGLKEFQISIGQVDYFNSLVEEAGLEEEAAAKLGEMISIRNQFGALEFLEKLQLKEELRTALGALSQMLGTTEVLGRARAITKNKKAIKAVQHLEDIYHILKSYGLEQYVTFDFGMLSKFKYYTGIIFQAYTYQTGEAVVTGGRYNDLLEHFGKRASAVGFTILMDQLQSALERQGIRIPVRNCRTMILYADFLENMAVRIASDHRLRGMEVACVRFEHGRVLEDYKAYGRRAHFGGIVYLQSEQEAFAINLWEEDVRSIDVAKYLL